MLDDYGHVAEQTVIVELQDGTTFYLEDNAGNSRDETVGTIKTLGILVDLANVEKLSSPKKGVETTYRLPEDPADSEGLEYLEHPHIVFSMEELIRYVLFRDRLVQVSEEE